MIEAPFVWLTFKILPQGQSLLYRSIYYIIIIIPLPQIYIRIAS